MCWQRCHIDVDYFYDQDKQLSCSIFCFLFFIFIVPKLLKQYKHINYFSKNACIMCHCNLCQSKFYIYSFLLYSYEVCFIVIMFDNGVQPPTLKWSELLINGSFLDRLMIFSRLFFFLGVKREIQNYIRRFIIGEFYLIMLLEIMVFFDL